MSLIGTTYFVKDIAIPITGNTNLVNDIAKYEPEILKKVLGYELWALVDAYDAESSEQRILDLVDGKDYTVSYNGRDQAVRWAGLRDSTNLISLIAYYTYFMWQTNNHTHTTNVGQAGSSVENSVRANPSQKMGSAWYRMRQLVGYNGQNTLEPSLYNFLTKYVDDYPEWVFTDVGKVNMYGI